MELTLNVLAFICGMVMYDTTVWFYGWWMKNSGEKIQAFCAAAILFLFEALAVNSLFNFLTDYFK